MVANAVREGEGDFGYNARTEVFENLFEAGVIDPTKVTRVALENAVSISGMVLITECVIADEERSTCCATCRYGRRHGRHDVSLARMK